MTLRLWICFLLILVFGSQVALSASKSPDNSVIYNSDVVPGITITGKKTQPLDNGDQVTSKRRSRLFQKKNDWRIYPRGWFFICLGIAAVFALGAFALVEIPIASTVLAVAAILSAIVALYFLALWIGYYWNY